MPSGGPYRFVACDVCISTSGWVMVAAPMGLQIFCQEAHLSRMASYQIHWSSLTLGHLWHSQHLKVFDT